MTDAVLDGLDARASTTLRRLAAALARPVGMFFGPPQLDDPIAGAEELLRLWAEIPDAQARRRVLSFAQREAECCGAPRRPGRGDGGCPGGR